MSLSNKLKKWKPIHLCWLFEKYGLPIPKYLIGGASKRYQDHYKIGDDDSADPDTCTFDALDTIRTGQAKNENLMVRIQVHGETAGSATATWQLYYNTSDTEVGATKVTTISTVVKLVSGTPTDGDPTNGSTVVFDASGSYDWHDGEYSESDDSDKLVLEQDHYTDLQWCVQFDDDAGDETTYYFFVKRSDSDLTGYNISAKVETEAGVGPSYDGILKRYSGAAWVKEPLETFLAESWQEKPLKRWNGAAWVLVDTTGV